MQSKDMKKIVFTDSEKDIALTGYIKKEDDFFIYFENIFGNKYRIGKKAVVFIREEVKSEYRS